MIKFDAATWYSKALVIFLFVSFVVVAFTMGRQWEQFLYVDKCLDMGGGMNPGGYSICVVEVTSVD